MTLKIQNEQGACQEYRNVTDAAEAREIIAREWDKPEELKATLIDEGKYIWDSISAEQA